jgi:hypothetical protein
MMKHEPITTASALAVTIGVIYIVCRVAITLFPGQAMIVAQAWFHGLQLNSITGWDLSIESFLIGLVTSTVVGWIAGYTFAKVYNTFLKK